MLQLKTILKEWEQDSKINKSSLEDESLLIPQLHSKYIQYLYTLKSDHKLLSRNISSKEDILTDYYSGSLDGKDIGKPPFQLTLSKAGIEKKVKNDPDIKTLNIALDETETCIEAIQEIVKQIHQRSFQLKNAIDYIKWKGGEM